MPGLADAISAARIRTEQAEQLLSEGVRFASDDSSRAHPEAEWRSVVEKALHALEEAAGSLRQALARDDPSGEPYGEPPRSGRHGDRRHLPRAEPPPSRHRRRSLVPR
jgi:hypothetical protein